MNLALLLAAALLPFHGVVLAPLPGGQVVVQNAPITDTVSAATRRYRLDRHLTLRAGTGIDAFLDRSTQPWTLRDVVPAGPFVAGMPNPGDVQAVDNGTLLPKATLVNQDGKLVQLRNAFLGKTTLISFMFTRCKDTDVCIAITTKYSQLQHVLDPSKFALVEISLDPPYDSPAVLRAYGEKFGRDSNGWTLLTGTGSTISRVLDAFGISSLQTDSDDYLHSDKLFVVTPQGRIAYVVDTATWDPRAVAAEARNVAGLASNPIERFKLSLIASISAFCGGSQYAGIVMLDMTLILIISVIVGGILWKIGRVLWAKPSKP